ncbi:unnamed protein product [Pedinophyceae sp. YPF-701]|nr:unnamed protein product [Pedinophyceae sp. YPF-701]
MQGRLILRPVLLLPAVSAAFRRPHSARTTSRIETRVSSRSDVRASASNQISSASEERSAAMGTGSAAALGAPLSPVTVDPATYPAARRDESVVDQLHGVQIPDPYRWLEDPDSEETKAFVAAQNEVTDALLAACPSREAFKQRMTEMWDYEKFGCPFRRGKRVFYYHNSGLQAQSVLWMQDALDAPAKVLLDPNTLSEDGTVALGGASFSEDGTHLAYKLSSGGSDWQTIHVLRIDDAGQRHDLPDKLTHVKFSSLAWTHDGRGFFYCRFPKPRDENGGELGTETDINLNMELYYHVLGTPQDDDVVVWKDPEHPSWMCGAEVSDDGRYLLLSVSVGCQPMNRLWYADLAAVPRGAGPDGQALSLQQGALQIKPIVDDFSASWDYVANEGAALTLHTNHNAPRYRLVRVDLDAFDAAAGPAAFAEVVPQHEKDVLEWATALQGDALVLCWMRDVKNALELRSLADGRAVAEIPLPGIGAVQGFAGRREDADCFFKFVSFTEPGAIFRCDVAGGAPKTETFRSVKLPGGVDLGTLETRQVFCKSKDGTSVPMFVVHKKGMKLDGSAPALLYGYGGFNISLTPSFSVARLVFALGYGGVLAYANCRGGGEYGIGWREAGSVLNKQNVFDDFQACAEHLIAEKLTSPARLAIEGGSNGGLLVAACCNQRPDLYGCVIGRVGVMDMLRFHKFTIGHAWTTDFGDPDKEGEFQCLLRYSPLHNVRRPEGGTQNYPPVILTTGDHDDRVVPLHSLKLIATLQHELCMSGESPQRNPLVVRVEVRAGHGAGKPTAKVIQETADVYAFAAHVMNVQWQA